MYSLLQSVGDLDRKPVANLGFPFHYYYQFWPTGADSPNCGWHISYFVWDAIIIWFCTLFVYFLIRKINKKIRNS